MLKSRTSELPGRIRQNARDRQGAAYLYGSRIHRPSYRPNYLMRLSCCVPYSSAIQRSSLRHLGAAPFLIFNISAILCSILMIPTVLESAELVLSGHTKFDWGFVSLNYVF